MKIRYNGPSDELGLINGKVYEVIGYVGDYYIITDEVGDKTFWEKEECEIIEGDASELEEL